MKKIDTTKRTSDTEIMDDFDLQGSDLKKTLNDLEKINNWLGGNHITIQGVRKIIEKNSQTKIFTILDVGCGNGSILRELAKWARTKKLQFRLLGIDANPYAIEMARNQSKNFPEIEYESLDIFSEDFRNRNYDILLCTLTLHHFKNKEIQYLLKTFYNCCKYGVVINDLQRRKTAHYLFRAFCKIFIRNKIARNDGLTSILRSFKKEELEQFSLKLNPSSYEIRWKWAFRYQWILFKN